MDLCDDAAFALACSLDRGAVKLAHSDISRESSYDAGAKLAQERQELMIEAMGSRGFGWEGEGFDPVELGTVRAWLRSKGNSIEGGSSEVNLNVVAKRVLALPDPR